MEELVQELLKARQSLREGDSEEATEAMWRVRLDAAFGDDEAGQGRESDDGGYCWRREAAGARIFVQIDGASGAAEAEEDGFREADCEQIGEEAMVDAAGVASNFQRMVRIADSTGIPLGDYLEERSAEVREQLDLGRFQGA